MKTVGQVSKISGVSTRTLRYYDSIDLLKPLKEEKNGYRYYDEAALEKLREILFLKELGFELSEIKEIISNENFKFEDMLKEQIEILEIKKRKTERLLRLAREISEKGGENMDFSAFNSEKEKEYRKEAKERWGNMDAYRESEDNEKKRTDAESTLIADGLMKIFVKFSDVKNLSPKDEKAQTLVLKLKNYISENYYECNDAVLSSLGQMYALDERFRENIDGYASEGTAEFAAAAIAYFVSKEK